MCSVPFRLAQRHACTQACLTAFSAHPKAFMHTQSAFNRIQYSLKGVHAHSEHIQVCSSMFKHVQWWSHKLKGIQTGQTAKGSIDTCLDMKCIWTLDTFASNVVRMFFNVLWLNIICQKTNNKWHKLQYWEGGNLIGNQNNNDHT